MASDASLTICADPAALAETAANLIIDVATEAVRERGRFMLCLAGGETPRKTYERLALPAFSERVRWDRTWAFFGDERVVPPDQRGLPQLVDIARQVVDERVVVVDQENHGGK